MLETILRNVFHIKYYLKCVFCFDFFLKINQILATPPFEDIAWVMESYGELGSLKSALPEVEVTLFFDSLTKKYSGNTGCNDYFGPYKVGGRRLSLPEGVAHTQLRCEQIMQQEEEYIGLFSMVDSYQIENGKLRLNCDHQVIYYISEPAT